ncbi:MULTISPECIES: endonuclease/exonuclease/phosphatase family protein [unclassified Arenibacter]|uniref:endonuclease/exonuclease/phosphatase family protein n=1 Tax=unclassified Arenibacter TaxID=2615047 RepID=UPI000E34138E|nr:MULTISPECIES: endonuclease/exonuclease/phosphatase family protein [unclassified Arenibacter]MCM4162948.1 endonuclease [Arenibacter sp. A80]RFT56991.1 endonuclease/exonuclease/phosphatase family protein [Arenibacter sp. P308M17]
MKNGLVLTMMIIVNFVYSQNAIKTNVMSFNIRYDEPQDKEQNWHQRKENVVRMLKFYDLDMIGLQEVLLSQLNYLKSNLDAYEVVGVGREDGKDKGEFVPIFYKKDRYAQINTGTFWLSETPNEVSKGWDANLERIVTWVILLDKKSNREVVFFNTHFDHRGVEARIKSAELLKSKIVDLAQGRPVVLTGDFNSVPESDAIRTLTNTSDDNSLVNSNELAKLTYGPNWTSGGFDSKPFDQRRIIDYIFLKDITVVNRYAVFTEKLNEICLSDHCPVFTQIEM